MMTSSEVAKKQILKGDRQNVFLYNVSAGERGIEAGRWRACEGGVKRKVIFCDKFKINYTGIFISRRLSDDVIIRAVVYTNETTRKGGRERGTIDTVVKL